MMRSYRDWQTTVASMVRTSAFSFSLHQLQTSLANYAARAVASLPEVIETCTSASLAAKAATGTIPIVFSNVNDPLAVGLVASLAHPGGNVTGNTIPSPDLFGKRLEIIKQIVPGLTRVAVLVVPADPAAAPQVEQIQSAASSLGIEPAIVNFVEGPPIETQFEAVIATGAQATCYPGHLFQRKPSNPA